MCLYFVFCVTIPPFYHAIIASIRFIWGSPHGWMELSDPQGVGLENEREPDSSLGRQLSPKHRETDVSLPPPPCPLISI